MIERENIEKIVADIKEVYNAEHNKYPKSFVQQESINEIVKNINKAYHQEWEKQKLEFARSFLARAWAGMPLPVLSLCGHGTQEIRYSKYLSYFLDGSGIHGLNTRYLDGLLKIINEEDIDTYESTVESEKWIGQAKGKDKSVDCYCDIVITCKDTILFIEQKINSSESVNPNSKTTQLVRYDEAISNNPEFDNKRLVRIYLTPTGKVSEKSPGWKSVSYDSLVEIGIDILHEGGIAHVSRENLKRFLFDLVLGPFRKTENEIKTIVELAEKSIMKSDFINRLHFDKIISDNKQLVKLIMEG